MHPVRSLDYVLITTGDAAVGEMFLPLVRVSKGYVVCETFATCGIGRAPSDWEAKDRQGGKTALASGPDISA